MTGPGDDRAALEARNAAMREQVQGLLEKFNRQTRLLQEAQEQAAAATATRTSEDGLVTATVDSSGSLRSLDFAPAAFQRSDPKRLARTTTETVRRAAAQVQQQLSELMDPIGDDLPDLPDLLHGAPSLRGLLPVKPDLSDPAPRQEERPAPSRGRRAEPDDYEDEDNGRQGWLR